MKGQSLILPETGIPNKHALPRRLSMLFRLPGDGLARARPLPPLPWVGSGSQGVLLAPQPWSPEADICREALGM